MPYKNILDKRKHEREYYQRNKEKVNSISRKSYNKNANKISIKSKERYKNNRKEILKIQKNYEKSDPKIRELKNIRRKTCHKIQLKPSCEICGSIEKLERHHWRYDKPLLVNTLCDECHTIQHVKNFQQSKYGGMILSH